MFVRTSLVTLLLLGLSACDSASPSSSASANSPAPANGAPPAQAKAAPQARETVSCAEHYGEVRDAILGTLRGTESSSLVALVTQHSVGVLSPLAAGTSPADANCRSSSRSFREKRKPGTTSAWPLAPQCSALLERVDARCLKPLAERGEPLSTACNLTLNGTADMSDGLKRKMGDGGFCESMGESL